MRAIWTGAIGFGLVNIPVKMYSATQGSELDLDMLDKKDYSNIRFKRVNEHTGKEVNWGDIVKGFKLKNKYVILTDKDESEIDTIYYETPYFLEPEKNGARAYALLRDALIKTGKVGIGTYVLRNKETLALLKPYEDTIILNRLRFAEEIRNYKDLNVPAKSKPNTKELQMAISLINELSEKFDITSYHDEYTEQLMKFIKAKARGVKIPAPKLKVVHRQTDDLMAQLKASLTKKKKKVS